jgi:hypothetical protein
MAPEPFPPPETKREELHDLLLMFTPYVYFQEPSNVYMEYPCIRYTLDEQDVLYANNNPYRTTDRYQLTIIDPDPDSPLPGMVASLPMCSFDRKYTADDLHHTVYNVYF